jgi:hypothetical protein
MNNIKEAIRQLAQGDRQTVSLVCTVDAVDHAARTVDCTPIDESAPLLGVNLQANQESRFGIVAFPKVGSFVVVGFIADGSAGVVLLTDEIESLEVVISESTARLSVDETGVRVAMGDNISAELTATGITLNGGSDTSARLTAEGITLNGGNFGGVVKVGQLIERINAIENDINNLKTVFSTWVAVPQDGGAALSAASAAWASSMLTPTLRSDVENEKVKH